MVSGEIPERAPSTPRETPRFYGIAAKIETNRIIENARTAEEETLP